MGNSYYKIKDLRKSYFFFHESLKFKTNDPEVYFKLSSIYYELKDLNNALAYITKCLELDPSYPNAKKIYNGLSLIHSSGN